MDTNNKVATVMATSPEHSIALQAHGWTMGCSPRGAFGWKRPHEVTQKDRETFEIKER